MENSMNNKTSVIDRFFAGLAQYVFQTRLGVADPPLVDYVSDLLKRFVNTDSLLKVRNPRGQQLSRLAEMMGEAEARVGDAKRDIHQHIGDFALFWAGLYPETLQPREGRDAYDLFTDYCVQGKRAYLVASSIPSSTEEAPGEILERLSDQFEMCAYGLREVRREWERRDDDTPPLLIG